MKALKVVTNIFGAAPTMLTSRSVINSPVFFLTRPEGELLRSLPPGSLVIEQMP
jgi:hypothetical protein